MDKKERNALDKITDLMLDLPIPEHAPADLKLSREMLRFSHKVHDALIPVSLGKDEELCAKLYEVLKESNDKILALCNGETIQEAPVFKVGQRVQFKTWEEMEAEFGLTNAGNIAVINFTYEMKNLCGTQATIQGIDENHVTLTDCEDDRAAWYFIDINMLKPAQEV